MILHDRNAKEVKIYGVKKDVEAEFVGIVNALKHQAQMTDKHIMELVMYGLADTPIFQNIKGFVGEVDEEDFKSVLEKMKEEYAKKEEKEKESE